MADEPQVAVHCQVCGHAECLPLGSLKWRMAADNVSVEATVTCSACDAESTVQAMRYVAARRGEKLDREELYVKNKAVLERLRGESQLAGWGGW